MKATIETPSEIICPITHEVMGIPMIAFDGFTYDRISIQRWVKKHNVSPMLGTNLESQTLIKNRTINIYLNIFRGMKSRIVKHSCRKTRMTKQKTSLTPKYKQLLDETLNHYYMATKELKECCIMMEKL